RSGAAVGYRNGDAAAAIRAVRKPQADMPDADHFDVEMCMQHGVEQRAMLDAMTAIDPVAGAECVKAVLCPGMQLARHLHRAAHTRHIEQAPACAFELGVDKSEVERGIVRDRKSTRLNSSHVIISYAVFCL